MGVLRKLKNGTIQGAGRLEGTFGKLTATIDANQAFEQDLLHFLDVIQKTA